MTVPLRYWSSTWHRDTPTHTYTRGKRIFSCTRVETRIARAAPPHVYILYSSPRVLQSLRKVIVCSSSFSFFSPSFLLFCFFASSPSQKFFSNFFPVSFFLFFYIFFFSFRFSSFCFFFGFWFFFSISFSSSKLIVELLKKKCEGWGRVLVKSIEILMVVYCCCCYFFVLSFSYLFFYLSFLFFNFHSYCKIHPSILSFNFSYKITTIFCFSFIPTSHVLLLFYFFFSFFVFISFFFLFLLSLSSSSESVFL